VSARYSPASNRPRLPALLIYSGTTTCQPVEQLFVAHLQGYEAHGYLMIECQVFGDIQQKTRFSAARTCSHDDELLWSIPASR